MTSNVVYYGDPTNEIYENLPWNYIIPNVGRSCDNGFYCGGWLGKCLLAMSSKKMRALASP